jgi:hypothetical protein
MKGYIKELPNFIELSFVKDLASKILTEEWYNMPDPFALHNFTDQMVIIAEDNITLNMIRNQYPKLAPTLKLMKCSKGSWLTHVDKHRVSAVNIPVFNCDHTKVTRFFTGGQEVDSIEGSFGEIYREWKSNEYLTYIKDADNLFDHILTVPTLVNTSKPHNIINTSDSIRVMLSWEYQDTFETAEADFERI